jgi:molybdopterin biosynthesis enzyme
VIRGAVVTRRERTKFRVTEPRWCTVKGNLATGSAYRVVNGDPMTEFADLVVPFRSLLKEVEEKEGSVTRPDVARRKCLTSRVNDVHKLLQSLS